MLKFRLEAVHFSSLLAPEKMSPRVNGKMHSSLSTVSSHSISVAMVFVLFKTLLHYMSHIRLGSGLAKTR